jgi:hypothetical protein
VFPSKDARRKEKDNSRLTRKKIGHSGSLKIPQMADANRMFFRYNESGVISSGRMGTQLGFGVTEVVCRQGWRMGAKE